MSQNPDLPSVTNPNRQAGWIANLMILAGVVLVIFAIGGLLFNLFPAAATASKLGPPRIGAPFGDFALSDLNGKTVHLSDYAGRPVLINTWATWCPPCRAEMPALNAFYEQHKAQGFVVLAINVGESADQARGFTTQIGLTFPILLDPDQHLADTLAIHDYPTSIMIGRDGKVKGIHIGMFTAETLLQEVNPLLGQ